MRAFIIGSRAQGNHKPYSDIDLVIYCDKETKSLLELLSDNGTAPIKFGNLNIICAHTPEEWAAWRLGTLQAQKALAADPTLDREDLMYCYASARAKFGIEYRKGDSGNAGTT